AVMYTMIIVALLYVLFGMSTITIFGTDTLDNVLLNLTDGSLCALAFKVLMLTILTCAYPLLCHCSRDAWLALVAALRPPGPPPKHPNLLPSLVSFTLYVVNVVVSVLVPSISTILTFVSGTFGTLIYFVVPAFFNLYIHTDPHQAHPNSKSILLEDDDEMDTYSTAAPQAQQRERHRSDSVLAATLDFFTPNNDYRSIRKASLALEHKIHSLLPGDTPDAPEEPDTPVA
ncbi:hypothetical protein KIPB_012673, partial [Kipferlia bialata]